VEPIQFLRILRRQWRVLTAFVEPWVRTLRHELLDRTLVWKQRQLHTLLNEYVDHYNTHPGEAPPGTLQRTP
jgi:hypothetical protein